MSACSIGGERTSSGSGQGNVGQYFNVGIFQPTGGTIESKDGLIRCGVEAGATACGNASGQTRYPASSVVVLTARPAPGYKFDGWAGDCTGTGDCTLSTQVTGADKYVVAVFVPEATYPNVYFTVTITKPINGTIRTSDLKLDCGSAPGATRCGPVVFPWNATAILYAVGDAGYALQVWSGDCTGTGTCTLSTATQASDKVVGAFFEPFTGPQPLVWDAGKWDETVWQ